MSEGKKYDTGKLRYDLLPMASVDEVVDVLTFGAGKYGDNNWQMVDSAKQRYFAAAMRHLSDWRQGRTIDAESGKRTLAHVMCCLLFLNELDRQGVGLTGTDLKPPVQMNPGSTDWK
jgi:hypothetical protein